MEQDQSTLDKLGGRKFILACIIMLAIVSIAILSPVKLTSEMIVGLLGVLATYSGSNAFLTNAFTKQAQPPALDPQPSAAEPQQQSQNETLVEKPTIDPQIYDELIALQKRVDHLEVSMGQIIEIVKQQNLALSKLHTK